MGVKGPHRIPNDGATRETFTAYESELMNAFLVMKIVGVTKVREIRQWLVGFCILINESRYAANSAIDSN